jgi:hypothetical protein
MYRTATCRPAIILYDASLLSRAFLPIDVPPSNLALHEQYNLGIE